MPVCLFACISQNLHVQTSRNFLYSVHVTRVRGLVSDDSGIRYVLPVLWMLSCFYNGLYTTEVNAIYTHKDTRKDKCSQIFSVLQLHCFQLEAQSLCKFSVGLHIL